MGAPSEVRRDQWVQIPHRQGLAIQLELNPTFMEVTK